MQFPQLNRSFLIVQAPDSNTWSHDGYTKKLDQIVPNITLYCQYMPISYHQWTYNKIQKITSTIENDRNTMTQHQSKPGDHFRPPAASTPAQQLSADMDRPVK